MTNVLLPELELYLSLTWAVQDTACSPLSPLCQGLCWDLLQLNTLPCPSLLPPALPRSAGTELGQAHLHTRTREGMDPRDSSLLRPVPLRRMQCRRMPLAEAEWVWEPGPCSAPSLPGSLFPVFSPQLGAPADPQHCTGPDGIPGDAPVAMSPGLAVRVPRSQRWPAGFVTAQDRLCQRGHEAACLFLSHLRVSGVTGSAESNPGHTGTACAGRQQRCHHRAGTLRDNQSSPSPLALPTHNSSCSWPGQAWAHLWKGSGCPHPASAQRGAQGSSPKGRYCC